VRPQPAHARQVVLELCELHLKLSLGAVRVVGEDVEDHRGAVDHRYAQRLLEIPLLTWEELVVACHEVRVRAGDLGLHVRELAAPDVAIGIGSAADLDDLANVRDAGSPQQLLELGEWIVLAAGRGQRPQAQGALSRPWILDPAAAGGLCGLRRAGSLHPRQV
jgi:hypothetical protein